MQLCMIKQEEENQSEVYQLQILHLYCKLITYSNFWVFPRTYIFWEFKYSWVTSRVLAPAEDCLMLQDSKFKKFTAGLLHSFPTFR